MELEVIQVIRQWMQGEFNNFIKVWLLEFASLCYCYFAAKIVPNKPFLKLLIFLPVVILNLILPFNLHTLHLGISTAFFLAWLCNFKLLMLAFNTGPLSDSSLSISHFLALACLPIKFHNQSSVGKKTDSKENPSLEKRKGLKSIWNYGIKSLLIPLFLKVYDYEDYIVQIHPKLMLVVYTVHIYVGLEILLAIFGGLARIFLGIELEPQFDEPYLSTSLQDFWGRRWNIMVTRILRPSVYEPVREFSKRVVGRKWAPLPAISATFMVTAIMHELVFFYMGRRWPTWEISAFFFLHGLCLVLEVGVKKHFAGRRGLPRVIAAPLAVGFVMVTGFWLFFPEFLKSNAMERANEEYAAMAGFVRDVWKALVLDFQSGSNATSSRFA
ncbi:OLC1v1010643C1 [Oldenlandia corymbosa var. corymbosa]|uniref:OLC1v1010643C1 n=1 Tax=Oldenlandia corymbosa var. corymbosa TaxID=529605 RepID=A0AAV1DRY9_OLDCO|nr:OLC1v1010643C1 [Oldenlandia corymbosa var. corymbosa]